MKTNYKKSFLGGVLAFVLGTSCCWLTSLAVWLGGATALTVLARFFGEYRTLFVILGFFLLALGIFQFWIHRKKRSLKPPSV